MIYIYIYICLKGQQPKPKNAKRQSLKRLANHFHVNTKFSFFKLNLALCKYWTSTKIKISMSCVYRAWEYEVRIKNWTGAMTTAKNEVFIGL